MRGPGGNRKNIDKFLICDTVNQEVFQEEL
jgi:hypothetical protein